MKYPMFFILLLAVFTFSSCGDKGSSANVAASESPATTESPKSAVPNKSTTTQVDGEEGEYKNEASPLTMSQAELQNKLRGYSGNIPSVEPLTVDQIKALMPNKLAGLAIYENEGETSAALGAPATFVVTIYRENYNIIKVAVTDSGAAPATILAAAQWSNQNINKNSDNGFDRTTTYKGYPAHEQYNNQTKVGMFEYIIGHRFIVSCQGKNRTIEQMRAAMDELNLDRLKNLKKS